MLGDRVALALKMVGITPKRVEAWLGKPCGCAERQEKLNQLNLWARRVVTGKLEKAKHYLEQIVQ
jgi:hypothetical protein